MPIFIRLITIAAFAWTLGCEPAGSTLPTKAGESATPPATNSSPTTDQGAGKSVASVGGTCGGLRGVQTLRLTTPDGKPAVPTMGAQFRFGAEADSLLYTTAWAGDLNGDGVTDQIAWRVVKSPRQVWMVLIGCGEEFGLAWTGVSRRVSVATSITKRDGREWTDLDIDSKPHHFDGAKYRP